jgi:hypothetical protein
MFITLDINGGKKKALVGIANSSRLAGFRNPR